MSQDCGYRISGSDAQINDNTKQLASVGVDIAYHQDGVFLQQAHEHSPIDWLVVSSAIPDDSAEIKYAQSQNIKVSKRDELIAQIIDDNNLKMIAIAGTHGKTSTTSMMVWALQQLGIDPSYIVGGVPKFGPAGLYNPNSDLFIYEADEFDRNFLNFSPYLSLITTVDYDHPDTYPTESEYLDAFRQFIDNSKTSIVRQNVAEVLSLDVENEDNTNVRVLSTTPKSIDLLGEHNRLNGSLVESAINTLLPDIGKGDISAAINSFPGVARRLEKLAEGVYSDYAHHPIEVSATLQALKERFEEVVVIYQPHQNIRQHQVRGMYKQAFLGAAKLYWLPTYLSREDDSLEVLTPEELISEVDKPNDKQIADMNDELVDKLQTDLGDGKTLVFMGAGSIDAFAREFASKQN